MTEKMSCESNIMKFERTIVEEIVVDRCGDAVDVCVRQIKCKIIPVES